MTLKTHLLLTLIIWVGLIPHAWAAEKTAPEKTTTKELREKAEKGDADAMFYLGVFYEYGTDVLMDETEAAKWFLKAAEKGHSKSQHSLGLQYVEGHGVPKDEAEAVKWYQKAAAQGQVGAQLNIGIMYAEGHGVSKDNLLAYKWVLLAGAKDEKSRENIAIVEKRLTPEQRAEGQKLAREFKPVFQKDAK